MSLAQKNRLLGIMGGTIPNKVVQVFTPCPLIWRADYDEFARANNKGNSEALSEVWMWFAIYRRMNGLDDQLVARAVAQDGVTIIEFDPFADDTKELEPSDLDASHVDYRSALHLIKNSEGAPQRFWFILFVRKELDNSQLSNLFKIGDGNINASELVPFANWIRKVVGKWDPDAAAIQMATKYPWLQYRMTVASAGKLIMDAFKVVPPVLARAMLGDSMPAVLVRAKYAANNPHSEDAHRAIPTIGHAFAHVVLTTARKQIGAFYSGQRASDNLPATTLASWRLVVSTYLGVASQNLQPIVGETAAQYAARVARLI